MFIKKFLYVIIISFVFLCGVTFYFETKHFDKLRNFPIISLDIFFDEGIFATKREHETLLEIEIPSIDLKESVYTMDSTFNNVNQHVQILEQSNLEDNFIFLAAHSGNSEVSYFNSLVNLEIGDMIQIRMSDQVLSFVVEEIFYIPKIGYIELTSDVMKDMLFLITCSLEYYGMQLVVRSCLIYS